MNEVLNVRNTNILGWRPESISGDSFGGQIIYANGVQVHNTRAHVYRARLLAVQQGRFGTGEKEAFQPSPLCDPQLGWPQAPGPRPHGGTA